MFWRTTAILLNFGLYALFGALIAFFAMAFSASVPESSGDVSTKLSQFLLSEKKSEEFSLEELNSGLFDILIVASEEESKATKKSVAMPTQPILLLSDGRVELCVPFVSRIANAQVKLGAFFEIEFNGDKIKLVSVRIGRARLPDFIGERIAKEVFAFYSPIKALNKYILAAEKIKTVSLKDKIVLQK